MLVLFFCQYCRLAAPYESDGQQPQTAETVVVNFDPNDDIMYQCFISTIISLFMPVSVSVYP